ncbi:hypothetical protein KSP40_PGU015670 [Platanthera guangdongensis]|uniref:Uncharacterized protein n=1 Tax=Platanthera guangdongensis TaxID=2320717 RepID=A0ABR2MGW1_9ASPA
MHSSQISAPCVLLLQAPCALSLYPASQPLVPTSKRSAIGNLKAGESQRPPPPKLRSIPIVGVLKICRQRHDQLALNFSVLHQHLAEEVSDLSDQRHHQQMSVLGKRRRKAGKQMNLRGRGETDLLLLTLEKLCIAGTVYHLPISVLSEDQSLPISKNTRTASGTPPRSRHGSHFLNQESSYCRSIFHLIFKPRKSPASSLSFLWRRSGSAVCPWRQKSYRFISWKDLV